MASNSRLLKRRQRTSCTSSPENHGEGDVGVKLQETLAVRDEMDMKDLGISARNKRKRSDMLSHVYDATEEGQDSSDEEFDVERGEVAPKRVAKSATEILNPNRRSLRPRHSPVWKMSTSVIGTPVPRKARSAFVKGLLHECPASGANNHQQHSSLAASEKRKKTASSNDQIGKATILSGSVDQDIELEVAEVLFGLMRQFQHPDTARKSQQKPYVSNARESESIKGDDEICTRKNTNNQAEESGGSELKLAEKYEDELLTEKTLIQEDGEKDTSLSPKVYELAFESRSSGVSESIPVAPLAECQAGKLEIDFMVSPNETAESISNSVEGSRQSPRDFDMKAMIKARKEMTEVTLEKQEKFMADTRHLSVAVHDTSLPAEQSYCGREVTKTAHITSAMFPMSKDLCMTDSSMGQMQSRETVAFKDNRFGSSTKGQFTKVSQNGWKRCATHYRIAQSIMCHQQCNIMSFKSPAAGSSCNNVSGLSFLKKDVIIGQSQGVIPKRNNIASGSPNIADSNCPRDKQTANEASCLPDSAQRKKYLNHKAPQLSPSEVNAPALLFPANQYQIVGLNSEQSGTSTSASSQKIASLSKNATIAGGPTTGSTFLMTDPAMAFYNPRQANSEAPQFMTIIPTNGYPLPISTPVGNSGSFKGGGHGHGMPYYSGSSYSPQMPQMFYPPQLHSQQSHFRTPILPSVQSTNGSSHSSSTHKQLVQQQHGPSVGRNTLIWPSAKHSKIPHKQILQSSHQTCNSGVEIADKKPLVVDNPISNGERIAYNQRGKPLLQQLSFTMPPMIAGTGNTKKFGQQESNKGPRVGIELPTSQTFNVSYSSFGGSNNASGINFSLPPQNPPLLPSIPDVAHRTPLAPQTADVVSQKKYLNGGTSGIDSTSAVSDRKGTIGKHMSWVSQAPVSSKADPYDQSAMMKGRSIFGSTCTKTHSFNSSPENANDQNRHHLQLLPQHAQGIWSRTPATNGQPIPGLTTNMSYSPVLMTHPAPWNSSVRSQVPQTTSTRPKNPPHQAMSLPSPTQFTFGGSNAKSLAAQGNEMKGKQSSYTLASSCQSPSPNSPRSSSRRNKSGSIASPTPQLNETSSSPSRRVSPSPVCRRNLPSILSNCPGQVSEVEH